MHDITLIRRNNINHPKSVRDYFVISFSIIIANDGGISVFNVILTINNYNISKWCCFADVGGVDSNNNEDIFLT
jgi:hypothetical protein